MLETFLVVQTLGMAVYVIIILIQSVWEKISKSSKETEFEEFFTNLKSATIIQYTIKGRFMSR